MFSFEPSDDPANSLPGNFGSLGDGLGTESIIEERKNGLFVHLVSDGLSDLEFAAGMFYRVDCVGTASDRKCDLEGAKVDAFFERLVRLPLDGVKIRRLVRIVEGHALQPLSASL